MKNPFKSKHIERANQTKTHSVIQTETGFLNIAVPLKRRCSDGIKERKSTGFIASAEKKTDEREKPVNEELAR